jgi:excisionase family DNA binding protein
MTFLTTKDLQDLIRVDKSTIYRMAEDGRIPAIKVGRQWRFPAEAVQAWLGGDDRSDGVSVEGRDLIGSIPPVVAQNVVDVVADALGVMVVLTDMAGDPVTEVANPCGLFAAVASQPGVKERCVASWGRYGAEPELVPRFHPGDFGFLCARAFVRHGSRLAGMVIAGGIAPAEWPPEPAEARSISAGLGVDPDVFVAHAAEVYHVDAAGRERIVGLLPKVAVLISNLVEERARHADTLAAIAGLADTRSRD